MAETARTASVTLLAVTLLTPTSLISPTIGDLTHSISSMAALNGLAS
jgi:hypothetical protein